MLTVRDLKRLLADVPDDTVVIIGNLTVERAVILKGRLAKDETYLGARIYRTVSPEKATVTTLQFERLTEFSDGSVDFGRI